MNLGETLKHLQEIQDGFDIVVNWCDKEIRLLFKPSE